MLDFSTDSVSCVCVCVRVPGVHVVRVGSVCGSRAVFLSSVRSLQHPRLHQHLLAARSLHRLFCEGPRHRHQHRLETKYFPMFIYIKKMNTDKLLQLSCIVGDVGVRF